MYLETRPSNAARDIALPINVARRTIIGRSVAKIMGLVLSMNIAVMVILVLRGFVPGHDFARRCYVTCSMRLGYAMILYQIKAPEGYFFDCKTMLKF